MLESEGGGNKKVIVPILIYLAGYGMTKIGHTIVVGKVQRQLLSHNFCHKFDVIDYKWLRKNGESI